MASALLGGTGTVSGGPAASFVVGAGIIGMKKGFEYAKEHADLAQQAGQSAAELQQNVERLYAGMREQIDIDKARAIAREDIDARRTEGAYQRENIVRPEEIG